MFCALLCTEVVHSHKHTLMSSSCSSLDWVLFHCAKVGIDSFVFLCLTYAYMSYYCNMVW